MPFGGTVHAVRGVSFAGKVLVFRGAKGSSGWSAMYHTARLAGTAKLLLFFGVLFALGIALDHWLPAGAATKRTHTSRPRSAIPICQP